MKKTTTGIGFNCFLTLLLTTVICSHSIAAEDAIPSKLPNTFKYSISGISSGGFMAAQMGVIYSSQVEAVGVVAGGFYNCAEDQFQKTLQAALKFGPGYRAFYATEVNSSELILGHMSQSIKISPKNPIYQATQICMKNPQDAVIDLNVMTDLQNQKLIDATENIKNQKVFLYQGDLDKVISAKMLAKNQEFYKLLNVPAENIKVIENPNGAHTFPTDYSDLSSCNSQGIPYVSSCELDLAGQILKQALGNENLIRNDEGAQVELFPVSQKLGGQQAHPNSIGNYGYMAASPHCLEYPEDCRVHVALHGCEMSDSFDPAFDKKYLESAKLGYLQMRKKANRPMWQFFLPVIEQQIPQMGAQKFAELSGYIDYVSDENKLIVLFPQTWITEDNYPGNPKGCWDWYGWTGSNYKTNQGAEAKWLHEWITRVGHDPKMFVTELPGK